MWENNNLGRNNVLKKGLFIVVMLLVLMKLVGANESIEKDSTDDIALASTWIMSEITQGGYLKPSMNVTVFDSDPYLMWELEGGWRFTNWFKLGFSLERTFVDVERFDNPVTIIGFVVGTSGKNSMIGDFTIDLNIGSFENGDSEFAQYFIEPGFHVKRRLYKKVYWTTGLTYRYVENESLALFGNDSFNSISFKLGITNNKY